MSQSAKQAEEIRKKKLLHLEHAIDESIEKAEELFKRLRRQRDPYAMHKAIESLPVSVLVEFTRRKTITILNQGAAGSRTREANYQSSQNGADRE